MPCLNGRPRLCGLRFWTPVTGSGHPREEWSSCQRWWPARAARSWRGSFERVTFANPETGYTIARIAPERGGADLITAVGPLLGAQIGEFLRLRGRWSSHPKYGRQFEVASYATVLPATTAGIQKYLGSGLIKGIGPVMAERMVAHFGVDIMHVIDDEPGRRAASLTRPDRGKITDPLTEIISMAARASRYHLEDVFFLGPPMLHRD